MAKLRLNQKRKYEKKLLERLSSKPNERFLLERLKKEWQELEEGARREKRRQDLMRIMKASGQTAGFVVLSIAALAGVAVIAAVAPNLFAAVGRMGGHRRFLERQGFKRELWHLEKRGYIVRSKKENKSEGIVEEVKLTEAGKQKVLQRVLGELKMPMPPKWDRLWRIVIFDIPNRHKHARDSLRKRLKNLGLYKLQKSAFIFPYPCREEVEFLTHIYNLVDYVRFIETDKLFHDDDLKEYFSIG